MEKNFLVYTNAIDNVWQYVLIDTETKFVRIVELLTISRLFKFRKLKPHKRTLLASEDLFAEHGDGITLEEWLGQSLNKTN